MKPEQREEIQAQLAAWLPDAEVTHEVFRNRTFYYLGLKTHPRGWVTLAYEDHWWAPGMTTLPHREDTWLDEPTHGFTGRGWLRRMAETAWRALVRCTSAVP